MKNNLLFTFLSIFIVGACFAQLPYVETFNTNIPASWQNIDNSTNNAGAWEWISENGDGFAVFNSDGYGDDGKPENADLISPAINCSANSFVALSFSSGFTQFASSVGTASVSADGGMSWSVVYTVNNDISEIVLVDITALAANQANVRVKFNFVGDWDYFWLVDDFTLYAPVAKDLAGLSITNAPFNSIGDAPFTVTGTLTNLGSETITSFDINYQIDGGAVVTAPVSGVNIGFGDVYSFSHNTPFTPATVGTYDITAYASNLNGGADAFPANDEVSSSILVFDVAVQRVPLFEVFTSSTCGPCTPGNINYHGIVDSKPVQDYVSIKYQQNFPGTGDPYTTAETVARRNFYDVNSIPRMEIDGGWDQNANSFTTTLYNDALSKPAFTFLHATYEVDVTTKEVTVNVEGLPIQSYTAGTYKIHVAVIENLTTANVKSNGETEFKQVAKKMMPSNSGTAVASLTALTPYTYSGSYTFNGNYRLPANGQTANIINLATEHSVEEFSDLRVVVWIEDEANKEVLQAFNAVAPLDTDGDGVPDEVEAYSGTSSTDANDFPDLDNDGLSDWKEVSDGTNPLEASVGIKEVTFEMAVSVSPVPASSVLNVAFALENTEDVSLTIISTDGKVITSRTFANAAEVNTSFDVSALTNGVYFMKIETRDGLTSKKFMVNHK
jgi:hypothetical protein